ncbi:DUF7847 domain-containing protein [Tepidibacter aestuarii]|uniref:DUF7847 domain-containing protein n=1 Tax=Tepidibacter aestuarii TaxID=2925782 RepID=UPI0020BE7CC3|nr:hypothetical protein [Tepidibacter aestuarii]CAH2213589.1 conserved membrane protein of unknown function [Tepidibacter aestuarii]
MYNSISGYFKLAFKNISKNPILIVPKCILLLVYLLSFVIGYFFIDNIRENSLIVIIGMLVLVALFEIITESGVLNMIKISMKEKPTLKDFIYGVKKYSGRILLGNILITVIATLVLFLFTQIIITQQNQVLGNFLMKDIVHYDGNSIITTAIVAFIILIIPFVIFCFLISFWKFILVNEDCDIQKSFSMSIKFVKKNIGLTIVISILDSTLTNIKGSKEFKYNSNFIAKYNDLISYGYFNMMWICLIIILKTLLNIYFNIIYFNIYVDRKSCIEEIKE